jgi:hypothetical protein
MSKENIILERIEDFKEKYKMHRESCIQNGFPPLFDFISYFELEEFFIDKKDIENV